MPLMLVALLAWWMGMFGAAARLHTLKLRPLTFVLLSVCWPLTLVVFAVLDLVEALT